MTDYLDVTGKRARRGQGPSPVRENPLRHIDRMREQIVAEIARDFRRDRQALAFGLLAQALFMEIRHRSSTDYALGWLDVMDALFQGTLDDAAQAAMRLQELEPRLH